MAIPYQPPGLFPPPPDIPPDTPTEVITLLELQVNVALFVALVSLPPALQ
jgi:hypothetical protein